MDTKGQTGQRVLLYSLVAMILPLVAFPARFGFELARASLMYALYELAYYGFVVFLFHRRASLLKLVEGAGVCLIYRLVLGAVFGLLVAAMYAMDVRISINLGMSGYLPAILFQIAIAPFVLKPVIARLLLLTEPAGSLVPDKSTPAESGEKTGRTSVAVSKQRGVVTGVAPSPVAMEPVKSLESTARVATPTPKSEQDITGFGRAVSYIGEHSSVDLAAVVDDEGLLLANFTRGQIEPEDWAPLALLFFQGNCDLLRRGDLDGLEKLDLLMNDKRLAVARSEGCCLMVISKRHEDDLLNIRINQGLDMINRFVAERYGGKLNSNAERIHVSSAQ